MTSTLNQPPASGATRSSNILKTWLPILLFGVLWADLIHQLSYVWSTNEQYAYGWFVPFFALALFWRRWATRPAPGSDSSAFRARSRFIGVLLSAFCFLLCLLLLPIRVIHEINQDWPLMSWPLAVSIVLLTLYPIYLAGGWTWVKHFAFPVCFILVAVQWPWRIENPLIQGLMRVVAGLTVELLGWFNIPALQHGNLIELATGTVGVNEACSGIRSFQSSLMAALLMGELYRLRLLPRATLVLCGLTLGFCFNVVRTLLLSWQANAHGLSAIEKWHDPAGLTIAVACFFALWAIAVLFQSRWRVAPDLLVAPKQGEGGSAFSHLSRRSKAKADQPSFPRGYLLAVGCWAVLCIGATEVWYRSHESKAPDFVQWSVALPDTNPTFAKLELSPWTLGLLKCDADISGKWQQEDGSEWEVDFFQWQGKSIQSIMAARTHRPEVCLPAAGLQQVAAPQIDFLEAGPLKLTFEKSTYTAQGKDLYVFYFIWQDGDERRKGVRSRDTADRLLGALGGRRRFGQQKLEIIVSGYSNMAEAERAVRQYLPDLIRVEVPAETRSSSGR